MTRYRYALGYDRVYHDLGLVEPGTELDLDAAPDPNWDELDEQGNVVLPPDPVSAELSDEQLAELTAPDLIAWVGQHPDSAGRVAALEQARAKPRSTVLAAVKTTDEE